MFYNMSTNLLLTGMSQTGATGCKPVQLAAKRHKKNCWSAWTLIYLLMQHRKIFESLLWIAQIFMEWNKLSCNNAKILIKIQTHWIYVLHSFVILSGTISFKVTTFIAELIMWLIVFILVVLSFAVCFCWLCFFQTPVVGIAYLPSLDVDVGPDVRLLLLLFHRRPICMFC